MRLFVAALLSVVLFADGARADIIYLAIGDSSAFGETDRTHNPSNGDRGYVKPFADHLATTQGGVRPTVRNYALDGETTRSYSTGLVSDRASLDGIFHNTNYAPYAPSYPSQRSLMLSDIAAAQAGGGVVKTVTVQFGANDLSNAAEAPGFFGLTPLQQQQVIGQTIQTVASNYAGILTDVRTLAPTADIYVIGYHNPYGGLPGHPLYDLAAPALLGMNSAIEQVGAAFGAKYVDFYPVVAGRENELTLINLFPQDLTNYVHLNDAGYTAVSQKLIESAQPDPVPAPPAVLLIGIALPAGWLLRRRAA